MGTVRWQQTKCSDRSLSDYIIYKLSLLSNILKLTNVHLNHTAQRLTFDLLPVYHVRLWKSIMKRIACHMAYARAKVGGLILPPSPWYAPHMKCSIILFMVLWLMHGTKAGKYPLLVTRIQTQTTINTWIWSWTRNLGCWTRTRVLPSKSLDSIRDMQDSNWTKRGLVASLGVVVWNGGVSVRLYLRT